MHTMHAGSHRFMIPLVTLAPPIGFRIIQRLPMPRIANFITVPDTEIQIDRYIFRDGETLEHAVSNLTLVDGTWQGDGGDYILDSVDDDRHGWDGGQSLAYLETHVSIAGDGAFIDMVGPSFYTVYTSETRKTFFNDNRLKYSDPPTVLQLEAYSKWIDGYPSCLVDHAIDADKSVVVINPYFAPIKVSISLEHTQKSWPVRVPPQSGVRVALSEVVRGLLGDTATRWYGQVYVTGKNRAIVFYADHSITDPCDITTLEHGAAYRGESTHIPISIKIRRSLGGLLGR